ncbi:Cellulose synthase catalytic subunit [UDP-forming] [Streptomyces sp. ADI96-02]|uniref:glycosyltransferase family 2 protein n=1 Tax=unclassified Streptomyces TaxID=2593676 RepID=UPI000F54F5E4|nr:cellulose synthase catalytic subunit [Streptomyces sp. ADI96-02]RPK68775.1 Cellulose synthase catalytic subunit [UDP-forming] [Streptomyces sp. ADI96-02]
MTTIGTDRAVEHRPRAAAAPTAVLPLPPSDTEKYGYVRRRLPVLVGSSIVGVGCLTVSQVGMTLSSPLLWLLAPFLAFTLIYYVMSLRVNVFTRDFDVDAHRALVAAWQPANPPSVDVFLPVCGEPVEVLRNTWTHVRALADRYPGECRPFVLDDSADPELRAMAEDFGFRYDSRANRGWFKKAGNLHFGFERTSGTYILILDADFAPRPDMLHELLPYLDANERLAVVQSPQYFRVLRTQNWIERGAGAVQELFYRVVQVSRQSLDGAICVGSCAVYRRSALQENGGTTLIEHSEDVHTGFDLRRLGWDLRYVPIALATGVCPDNAAAFHSQQYRWCSGSMSLLASAKFWQAGMRPATRLCYLSGFLYYLHTALFTFVAPLVPITLLLAFPDKMRFENLWLVLPALVHATIVFPLWHRVSYRTEAWAVRLMYGWAHVFAVWDAVRGRSLGWQATGSAAVRGRRGRGRHAWLLLWGLATSLLWVGAAAWRSLTMDPADFFLLLISGIFYASIVGRLLVQPRVMGAL